MVRYFKNYVPGSRIASFTSHLAEFIRAGVPLLKALELLQKDAAPPYFQEVLTEVSRRVRAGETFSSALQRTPHLFSPFYVSLVQAGEASGKLEEILERLAAALEKEQELRIKVGQALTYPAFVLLFGLATIFFLMVVMVPKISVIYTEFGGNFPWLTVVVLALSRWTLRFGWIFILLILFTVFYLKAQGKLAVFKKFWDQFSLKIPWIKTLVVQAEVARFARTLGILLQSGIPLLQGLVFASNTLVNQTIRERLQGIEKGVGQGKSFSESLRQRRVFPELALNFIWVGESTGNLDGALQKLGIAAEKEVDRQMKTVTTLLEPLILLGVGLLVALIVISLLLPIFQISLLVQ